MLSVLAITTPIYLLIGIGFLAARFGMFSGPDMRILGRFVLNVALPALVFRALAERPLAEILNGPYVVAYAGGSVLVFVAAFTLARRWCGKPLADSALIGMGASFSNSGFVGYPIVTQWLGPPAAVALALCMLVENTVMLPLTLALAESGRSTRAWHVALLQSLRRLATNPLILAISAGMIVAFTGIALPAPLMKTIGFLATASTAVALFVIGGTLVGLKARGVAGEALPVVVGKLIVHPLVVAALVFLLPAFDPKLQLAAIAYAGMPMLSIYPIIAQKYGREGLCAATLLLTMLVSFLTISAILWLLTTFTDIGT